MTRRQTILDELKKIVRDINGIAHVEVNKVSVPDLEIVAFPAVFIYGGGQAISTRAKLVGQKIWEWEVFLSFWTTDEDMENLYQKIYDKIADNPTLSRKAIDCDLDGVADVRVEDADRAIVSMSLAFNVLYRHEYGAA